MTLKDGFIVGAWMAGAAVAKIAQQTSVSTVTSALHYL